jgi:hypothetical protein
LKTPTLKPKNSHPQSFTGLITNGELQTYTAGHVRCSVNLVCLSNASQKSVTPLDPTESHGFNEN